MTSKGVGGRPKKYNNDKTQYTAPTTLPQEELEYSTHNKEVTMTESTKATVGNYIVVNTLTVNGLRINVEKLNSYAMNTDKAIGLAWSDGNRSDLKFDTQEEAQNILNRLDAICLK